MSAEQRSGNSLDQIIKLAIMAVGGQGGSVLTNWIEECARANGYSVQATSVAGVAQRTGATIYYVEMAPASGREPVFSLMPAAGDVDVLLAAELMEAGRAILRGFVTPDRTTLIASTHRALAVSEKTVPGDGMANSSEVLVAAEIAARRFIRFDMNRMAVENGTVISASLLGALAGSGCLPFKRDKFEAAIRRSGKGVEASLSAFAQAFERARKNGPDAPEEISQPLATAPVSGSQQLLGQWSELEQRIAEMPDAVREMALAGLRSVVDFQDIAYGAEYLDQLERVLAVDEPQHDFALARETAKYLARAMAYDDIFKVADLKTRGSRFERVRNEMKPASGARMTITEFMHPRAEELVSMLPAGLGRSISSSRRLMGIIDRVFNRGRRLRTDSLLPFLQLYVISGFRRWRRATLRHSVEAAHWAAWLDGALRHVRTDYAFVVELIRNRRLIKGYSDTHARGMSKFDKVNRGAMLVLGRHDGADWVRRLREAALMDEEGKALDGALRTVDSFVSETRSA